MIKHGGYTDTKSNGKIAERILNNKLKSNTFLRGY